MKRAVRRGVVIPAALLLPLSLGGVAMAATDPATPPVFTKTAVDPTLTGAAFVSTADVTGDVRPELVASQFGPYAGPAPQGPGTVQLYSNAAKNKQGGNVDSWTRTTVVPTTAGLYGPNQTTLSDVDGDGDVDVILPSGNFFQSTLATVPGFNHVGSGALTWWEQRSNGAEWLRHDIIENSGFDGPATADFTFDPDGPFGPAPSVTIPGTTNRNYSYHGVQHADLDGDGIKDLVTVGEDGGNPSSGTDDLVATQFLKGLGGGEFAAPVTLSSLGGSLPVVNDVNSDGKLDIVTAQFFGNVGGQPFGPPSPFRSIANSSFVWLQQVDDGIAGLTADDFAARKIGDNQGPSFQIVPVANFRGDGKTVWIGTNHTNKNPVPPLTFPPFSLYPEPAVYEFTPPTDPTANPNTPWAVTKLTGASAFTVTGGAGQAAPGGVGAGDLDGDGDIDLAVSGDGDRKVYWLEQKGNGSFALNQMPGSSGFGQAGGNLVVDLNRDGKNEAVWGSFDAGQVALWQR